MTDATLDEIIMANGGNRKAVISILQEIHSVYYYLPEQELRYVSEKLKIPFSKILFTKSTFFFNYKGAHHAQIDH